MSQSEFQQAGIEIQNKAQFGELRGSLRRVFASGQVERFLKLLERKGVGIRDFDAVLARGVLEQVDEVLGNSSATAHSLYEALTVADKGQMREFYLTQLEVVDESLREKFARIYRSY
ncbi:MAG TPA: hypothetical protein VN622_07775 [Clostridia bacterium]|nr:hypothetical protein [Clostridia bacterium]